MKIFSLLDTSYNSFSSKVKSYLSKLLSDYGTQFGSNTVFGQIMTVIGNTVQNLMLYIEDALVEQNKYTAQRKKSIYNLAALAGYVPSFGKAATASIKLNFVPVNIPEYNVILNDRLSLTCTQNGLTYCLYLPQEAIVLNVEKDNSPKYLTVVQGRFETQSFISEGGQYYSIPLKFNGNLDTDYMTVKVNNEVWEWCPSVYDMSSDAKQYTFRASTGGGIDFIFGNEAHGRALKANDFIEITYLIHDGENGNLNPSLETYFVFDEQVFDVNGDQHDGNSLFNITFAETDPVTSGCNSESIQHMREMIGLNSRSLVLASVENYKSYISKFGFCGYNRTWSDPGSMVVNSLIIKNFKSCIETGADYFKLNESDFYLTPAQKKSIYDNIEKSGRSLAGVKYNIFEPELCKYAMYVYITLKSEKYSKDLISNSVRQLIGEFFTNVKSDLFIPKSDIIQLIKNNVEGVDSIDIYILSQKNEEALRTKQYTDVIYVMNNVTGQYIKKTENVKLYDGENPNLGLDLHGNIWLKSDTQFPVLMGGWVYQNDNGDDVNIDDPLIITIN
jgi:hypothetical protein